MKLPCLQNDSSKVYSGHCQSRQAAVIAAGIAASNLRALGYCRYVETGAGRILFRIDAGVRRESRKFGVVKSMGGNLPRLLIDIRCANASPTIPAPLLSA